MTTILQALRFFLFLPILASLAQAAGTNQPLSGLDTPTPQLLSLSTTDSSTSQYSYDPSGALLHQQQSRNHEEGSDLENASATTINQGLKGELDAANKGLLDSQFSRNALEYVRVIERNTGFKLHSTQRSRLAENLRNTNYTRLSPEAGRAHRRGFTKTVKDNQIAEWERQTGQTWPRYQAGDVPKGQKAGGYYDAHHVIENIYGGPHEWWNLTPARFPTQHQSGIHFDPIMDTLFP